MATEVSETAIYVLGGALALPQLVNMLASFFKGSVARNIETADKAQAKIEHEVEQLQRDMVRLQAEHMAHKDSTASALGSIDGRLIALDRRVAEQGKAYEEKIETGFKKLEIELNRKLAQVTSELSRGRGRK